MRPGLSHQASTPRATGIIIETGDKSNAMMAILRPIRTAASTKRAATRYPIKAGARRSTPVPDATQARISRPTPTSRNPLAPMACSFYDVRD